MLPQPVLRPSPLRWVQYALTGRLPREYSSWILHDVTCRTWWLRHFARALLVIVPLLTLHLLLVPLSLYNRMLTGFTAAGGVMMASLVYLLPSTDGRAVRAGYRTGEAEEIRQKASAERQRTANYARRERIAERQARRRG